MDRGRGRPPWPGNNHRLQSRTQAGRAGHNGASFPSSSRGSTGFRVGSGRFPPATGQLFRGQHSSRGVHNNNNNENRRHQQQPAKGLDLRQLGRLTEEKTEPAEIIRFLGNAEGGLSSSLEEHLNDFEYLELVLLALGGFCQKNGATQFTEGFVSVVHILQNHKIFSQVRTIIKNTSTSKTGDRLRRLISAVYHLATEMIVMLPAFACNFLGEDFFTDILTLKETGSIQKMNITETFDVLHRGAERLQVAWEQHGCSLKEKKDDDRQLQMEAYNEVMLTQTPPDNFRKLNIMPTWDDIFTDCDPFLRPNLVKGEYPDADTYLDIQFRLLREDFFQPLRIGLQKYKNKLDRGQTRGRVDNVRPYYNVTIIGHDLDRDTFTLQFSTQGLKNIMWEGSKRLLYGALLFLSSDDFASFYLFTVADRNPRDLVNGRFKVQFEGTALPPGYRQQTFVMIESMVFFEAYRSVLIALQRMSPTHFPMEDYILGRRVKPENPDYLLVDDELTPKYDLSLVRMVLTYGITKEWRNKGEPGTDQTASLSVEQIKRLHRVEILDSSKHPAPEDLGLDSSQAAAFYAALTQKMTVIQGPPGTGKTYLGLRIVQTLLHNSKYWSPGLERSPILVICYTNHALDQFLEGIMKFTDKIVRVGGQSKCAALEPFAIKEWKKKCSRGDVSYHTRNHIHEIRDELRQCLDRLEESQILLTNIESFDVMHEDSLNEMRILPNAMHKKFCSLLKQWRNRFNSSSALRVWLGIESNQDLEHVLDEFQSKHSRKKMQKVAAGIIPIPLVKEGEIQQVAADDQWDKEDIDAIEAERFIETDDMEPFANNVSTQRSRTAKLIVLPQGRKLEKDTMKFAFISSTEDPRIPQWTNDMKSAEGDDVKWIKWQINGLKTQSSLIHQLLQVVPMMRDDQLREWCDRDFSLDSIPLPQRWMIYVSWKRRAHRLFDEASCRLEKKYHELVLRLQEVRARESAEVCSRVHVVGITTTGAAKQRGFLDHLKAKIVIVEEAAEVLEAHTVTALSASCQQLILIGDHQQLRPSTTVYRLAKDYSLDVSFFERLIKNGMDPCVLGVQHRMRPEVARLIVPAIYPTLENHPSVLEYPNVRGMASNVFFLSHTEMEVADNEGKSHLNPYEAEIALALARHLLMQGYSPEQITILTTYSGQLLHLRKLRRMQKSLVQSIRISVVDNFQGEENDIIILSLVRSNEEENIGFLRIENRICVALSRAKQGFFMIGNMNNLQGKSKLWDKISNILDANDQIGSHFELKCQVHEVSKLARQVEDFPPEGGCLEKCLTKMLCGHICPKLCHAEDRDHQVFKCLEKCTRRCPEGHSCDLKCCNTCLCRVKVIRTLPCGHEQEMKCYQNPDEVLCQTIMWKSLPHCDHRMELLCSASPGEATCPEVCGMELDCSHICQLKCHKRSSHKDILCRQPCKRTCPEGHPCAKECFSKCDQCLVMVNKKLPCDHEKEVNCFRPPQSVYCNVKVEKVLSNCQHVAEVKCSEGVEGFKCPEPCEKIMCEDGHFCKKKCFESCGRCHVRMEREFNCGHKMTLECFVDPSKIKCPIPKKAILPFCNHTADIKCGEDPTEARCPLPCDVRLDCGHTCTLSCHMQKDPEHQDYQCKKPCERFKSGCKKDHRCGKKCFEDCNLCETKWKRTLPCEHSIVTQCHYNDEDIFCRVMETKTIAECEHEIRIECSAVPTRKDCKEECKTILECDHRCKKRCREPCSRNDCVELVKTTTKNLCDHFVTVPCKDLHAAGGVLTDGLIAEHLNRCSEPCTASLACQHQCRGTCGACFNGRVHRACQENCGRTLVCGHSCKISCAISCPPCSDRCDFKCEHSKCHHKCCEPCTPCKEKCGWHCQHSQCTRKCGDLCNRKRCDLPCSKLLKCQHPCVGLCGELCPPLCRICDKETLTEFQLLGNEEEDDARFVLLPDCGHCIEVEGMDQWMDMKGDGEIMKKCCPRCKTPVRNCLRYGNVIKAIFRDIMLVKQKMFNMRDDPNKFYKEANASLHSSKTALSCSTISKNHCLSGVLTRNLNSITLLLEPKKGKKKGQGMVNPSHDASKRYFIQVNLDFIKRVLQLFKTEPVKRPEVLFQLNIPAEPTTPTIKPELLSKLCDQVLKLLELVINRDTILEEEYRAIVEELERLDLMKAHFTLQSTAQFASVAPSTQEQILLNQQLTKNINILEEEQKAGIKSALRDLAKKLNTGIGISDTERMQIVAAMGMTQGHWFKCPNGHVYAIADCGGATIESRCNECGAAIGGASHRLRADNRLAPEMDGAVRSAWPGSV